MKIGFLTNFLVNQGMKSLEDLAKWALENGFEDLEVGPTVLLNEKIYEDVLKKYPVSVSSLTYCRNFLSCNKEEAELHVNELKRRIELAGRLKIEKVVTSTGIDKSVEEGIYDKADAIRKIPARSLDKVVELFSSIIEVAEKNNVKIAFENCPLMGNIAISPVMWEKIFDRIKSDKVGLAYDPSHLVWQFIDPYEPILKFGHKIFHVHAKDTEIFEDILKNTGILTDFSWWRYRLAGMGCLDWRMIINNLRRVGFKGTISIEHEDPLYEGSLEKVKQGILIGRENLLKAMDI